MDLFDLLFRWRRDRREARHELRDMGRYERESRQELLAWFKMLLDSAPDDEAQAQAKRRVFDAVWGLVSQLQGAGTSDTALSPAIVSGAVLLPERGSKAEICTRLLALARQLRKSKQSPEALALVEMARELGATDEPDVVLLRAELLNGVGRFDDAMAEVDRVGQLPAHRRQALTQKCFMLLDRGATDEAVVIAEEMFNEKEDLHELVTLGLVAAEAGQLGRARQLIDRALEERPNDPLLLEFRLMLAAHGQSADVRELASQVLEVIPDSLEAHRIMAATCIELKEPAAAVRHARRVADMQPDSIDSHLLLAQALGLSEDHAGALQELALADDLQARDVRVSFYRLFALVKLPDSCFPVRGERHRRIVSAASAVIDNPRAPAALRATALVIRSMNLLLMGARTLSGLDFEEAKALGISKPVEAIFAEYSETITWFLSLVEHPEVA